MNQIVPVIVASLVGSLPLASRAEDAIVPYTGRLVEAGLNVSGERLIRLALVDAEGQMVWSNSPIMDGVPMAGVPTQVNGGLYQLEIGNTSLSNMAAFNPELLASGGELKLRVWVGAEGAAPVLVTPDLAIRHSFQAIRAEMLGNRSAADIFGQLETQRQSLENQSVMIHAQSRVSHDFDQYLHYRVSENDQRIQSYEKSISPEGSLELGGGFIAKGTADFSGPVTLHDTLSVAGATTLDSLSVLGNAKFNGAVEVPTPEVGNHAANRAYVDQQILEKTNALAAKAAVRVGTLEPVNLETPPAEIDGVSLVAGDRVLLLGQTDSSKNGVYTFAGTEAALIRSEDFDSAGDFVSGAYLFVREGSLAKAGFVLSEPGAEFVLESSPLGFTRFTLDTAADLALAGRLNVTGSTAFAGDAQVTGQLNVSGTTSLTDANVTGALTSGSMRTMDLQAEFMSSYRIDAGQLRVHRLELWSPFGGTRLDGHFNRIGGYETHFEGDRVRFDTWQPVEFRSGINTTGALVVQREWDPSIDWQPESIRLDGISNLIGGTETRFNGGQVLFETQNPVFFGAGMNVTGTSRFNDAVTLENSLSVVGAATLASVEVTGGAKFNGAVEVPTPEAGNHAANRAYVDQQILEKTNALAAKAAVRVGTLELVSLETPPAEIDGVSLVAGDRVLLLGQTDSSKNGVYTFAGTEAALIRSEDFDSADDFASGAYLFVREGSLAKAGFVLSEPGAEFVLETSPLGFTRFTLDTAADLALAGRLDVRGSTAFAGDAQVTGQLNVSGTTRLADTNVTGHLTTGNMTSEFMRTEGLEANFLKARDLRANGLGVTGDTTVGGDAQVAGQLSVTGTTSLMNTNVAGYLTTREINALSVNVSGSYGPTRFNGFYNDIGGIETRFTGADILFDTLHPVEFRSGIANSGTLTTGALTVRRPDWRPFVSWQPEAIHLDGISNFIGGNETRFNGDQVRFETLNPVSFSPGISVGGTSRFSDAVTLQNSLSVAGAATLASVEVTGGATFNGAVEVPAPEAGNHAANRAYVDQQILEKTKALAAKAAVRVGTLEPVNLETPPAEIDGVTLVTGDRVLLLGQSNLSKNGVYTFAGTEAAMIRSEDFDSAGDFASGAYLFVREGSLAKAGFVLSEPGLEFVLESSPLGFTRFTLDTAADLALAGRLNVTGSTAFAGDAQVTGQLDVSGTINLTNANVTGNLTSGSMTAGYTRTMDLQADFMRSYQIDAGELRAHRLELWSPFEVTRLDGYFNNIGGFETRFSGERVRFDTLQPVEFRSGIYNAGALTTGALTVQREWDPSSDWQPEAIRLNGSSNLISGGETRFLGQSVVFDADAQFNRSVTAETFASYSDARLKENVADSDLGIETVTKLRPVTYEFIKDSQDRTHVGFIAQELREVLPDLVSEGTDPERLLKVETDGLIPVLVKAVQEQQDTITKQQKAIELLEARLLKLEESSN